MKNYTISYKGMQFHSFMQPIQRNRVKAEGNKEERQKGEGQSPPRCEMGLINLRLIV